MSSGSSGRFCRGLTINQNKKNKKTLVWYRVRQELPGHEVKIKSYQLEANLETWVYILDGKASCLLKGCGYLDSVDFFGFRLFLEKSTFGAENPDTTAPTSATFVSVCRERCWRWGRPVGSSLRLRSFELAASASATRTVVGLDQEKAASTAEAFSELGKAQPLSARSRQALLRVAQRRTAVFGRLGRR